MGATTALQRLGCTSIKSCLKGTTSPSTTSHVPAGTQGVRQGQRGRKRRAADRQPAAGHARPRASPSRCHVPTCALRLQRHGCYASVPHPGMRHVLPLLTVCHKLEPLHSTGGGGVDQIKAACKQKEQSARPERQQARVTSDTPRQARSSAGVWSYASRANLSISRLKDREQAQLCKERKAPLGLANHPLLPPKPQAQLAAQLLLPCCGSRGRNSLGSWR